MKALHNEGMSTSNEDKGPGREGSVKLRYFSSSYQEFKNVYFRL
jgi:hypothetical protein